MSAIFIGGMVVFLVVAAFKTYWQSPGGQGLVANPVFSRSTLFAAIAVGGFAVWFSGRLVR